jgi:tetratricopeptide (TPR) repeat protein
LADFDALLEMDSTRSDVLNKKIMVLEKMKDDQGMLDTYLKMIRLEPDNYLHYGKTGEMYYRLDQNEEAIQYLSKSMEMNRQYYQPLMLRGNAYYKIGAYKKALADFERFAQITNDPSAFYNTGMSHMMLGEMQQACESWQKALELGHQSAEARIRENCR